MGHNEKAVVLEIIGDVKDKTAVIVDDFTISGGTLTNVSVKLMQHGAREVYAVVTHGVLTPGSVERIDNSPIKRLIITDTVENQPVKFSEKIEVVSVASLFGEAIKRIHNRESISEMFK
jgi:ribose-phosphate pyrophosphokinase